MIHHFLKFGHSMEWLLNLSLEEKLFLQSSMLLHYEEEAEKYKT